MSSRSSSILRDVATSKLASDLSARSKRPQTVSPFPTSEIYSWTSQLASESRKLDWGLHWYVWPDAVREVVQRLETMSGGIIGRFLRHIALTLRHWERNETERIDTTIVKQAVTVERLAEDMGLELAELFPKHSDLRLQVLRLLMHLEEFGPRRQTDLVEALGIEDYAMSRLLGKLELHRYILRRREGTDKIVSLRNER